MIDPKPWSDSFASVVNTVSKHIVSSVLTVFLGSMLYLGYETVQRGSFWDAVQVLVTSKQERERQAITEHANRLQDELRATAASDRVVHDLLTGLLAGPSGNAVRARIALIHNSVNALNQSGLLKYDLVAGVAERGRAAGELVANKPLSQWTDYLPDLIGGRCKYMDTAALSEASKRARLDDLGIVSFLVCPVREPGGALLGALFVSWDEANQADATIDLASTLSRTMEVADRLGVVYSIRPKLPPMTIPSDH